MEQSGKFPDKTPMDPSIQEPPAPAVRRQPPTFGAIFAAIGIRILSTAAVMTALVSLIFFPWATDAPLTPNQQADLQKHYATAYEKATTAESEDSVYVKTAREAAEKSDVKGNVAWFVRKYGLADKAILDVGAGRGYLQDVVQEYTALDISPSAKRFFHKPFVLASATLMPLADNQFDAAWTIWVMEHVPNPEAALAEMRRVVKEGGYIFLAPAWDCEYWAADGYPVRPYSDFGLGGKLIKATIPLQLYFWNLSKAPIRTGRYAAWKISGQPTKLRYRRLTPNYTHYWMGDSDAINTLDRHEVALWFLSRGDECLNCQGAMDGFLQDNEPLILRIHKRT
jgi:ubiquinone/menaquinone biosynthesis C-methylase UbiE